MEIETIVQEELAKIIESGKVREMVAKSMENSIKQTIEDSLRQYSDFGKAIATKVKDAIGVELGNVNLQTAVIGLGHLVEAQVNRYVTEQSHPQLLKMLDELFKPAPKSITLQEMIDAYKEDEGDDARSDGFERCGLIIGDPDSSGYIQVGLNPEPEKRSSGYSGTKERIRKVSDCELKMHLKPCENGYQIYWLGFGDYGPKSSKDFLPMALYGFARQIFQMYAAGTVLVIESKDADDYDTHYPGNDY